MEELNIKEFFNYLKSYWLAFIIAVVVMFFGTLIYDLAIKTPIYQARTTVVVAQSESKDTSASATLNDVNASQKLVSTYGEIAKSELVLNQVIANLNLNTTAKALNNNITVKPVDNTSILSISVKDPNAKQAADIANQIAKVFTKETAKIYKLDNVSSLSVAETPESPANNTTARDLLLASAFAVFGVTAFAFLKFYLDDTVKYSEDLESRINIPIAGRVVKNDQKDLPQEVPSNPTMGIQFSTFSTAGQQKQSLSPELVVEKFPKAMVSENIKSLRTNLQFTAVDKDLKTILVTSTNAGEGKSFVASNLAVSFAQADKRVLLVDCDLRKGRLHKIFNVPNMAGLSNLLTDDLFYTARYIQPTNVKNLSLITCGTYPPNPSELLSSLKNKTLIAKLRNDFDIVIFDGAPVNGLSDSVILSSLVDETLIVTRDAATARAELQNTKESLEKVKAKVAGVVMNAISRRPSRYYYNYYYGYGSN